MQIILLLPHFYYPIYYGTINSCRKLEVTMKKSDKELLKTLKMQQKLEKKKNAENIVVFTAVFAIVALGVVAAALSFKAPQEKVDL